MQKFLKLISLAAGILILASCETTQSVAAVPVVTPTGPNETTTAAPNDKPVGESAGASVKENDGVDLDASATSGEEAVPAEQTKTTVSDEPAPVPAKTDETPQEEAKPPAETIPATQENPVPVRFRIAYWQRPEETEELFIKTDGEFKRCEIFEMAFQRAYSVTTPIILFRMNGETYEPYLCVDNLGFTDCAALILPGYDTKNPEGTADRLQVFSFDDKDSPGGSIVIYNWFCDVLEGKFHFRGDARNPESEQVFSLKFGEHCKTVPIKDKRRICEVELYSGTGDERKLLFSSGMPVRGGQCTYFFAIPKEGGNPERPRPDFKFFQISK